MDGVNTLNIGKIEYSFIGDASFKCYFSCTLHEFLVGNIFWYTVTPDKTGLEWDIPVS